MEPHVSIYLDDILVIGTTEADHLKTLDEVLSHLETAGLKLKQNKGVYLLPSIEYLELRIPAKGLQPTDKNIWAINK